MHHRDFLSIGQLAKRTGLAVSAIRYYEEQGLVKSERNAGGQRRFRRADIRRLSFVQIAQQFDFSLKNIAEQLSRLPDERTPTKGDWAKISRHFRADLDARIATLEKLRDTLDGCIGCGCLSLKKCQLYNPQDEISERGTGARFLMGDAPEEGKL